MGKKDFSNLESPMTNPALKFITSPDEISGDTLNDTDKKMCGKVGRPKAKEKRSKRVVLLLKPSMYDKMKKVADDMELSVNEFYENLLKEKLKKVEKEDN